MWSSTVNDIVGCIGHDSAVVLSDLRKLMNQKTLRKIAVVILALGYADQVL
jgi:hypothetical protein